MTNKYHNLIQALKATTASLGLAAIVLTSTGCATNKWGYDLNRGLYKIYEPAEEYNSTHLESIKPETNSPAKTPEKENKTQKYIAREEFRASPEYQKWLKETPGPIKRLPDYVYSNEEMMPENTKSGPILINSTKPQLKTK
jgi:hypothetical protein